MLATQIKNLIIVNKQNAYTGLLISVNHAKDVLE